MKTICKNPFKPSLLFSGAVWGYLLLPFISVMSISEMTGGMLIFLFCRCIGEFIRPNIRQTLVTISLLLLLFLNIEFLAIGVFGLWFSDLRFSKRTESLAPLALGILAGVLLPDIEEKFFLCTLLLLFGQIIKHLWSIVPAAILILLLIPVYEGVLKKTDTYYSPYTPSHEMLNFILAYGAAVPDDQKSDQDHPEHIHDLEKDVVTDDPKSDQDHPEHVNDLEEDVVTDDPNFYSFYPYIPKVAVSSNLSNNLRDLSSRIANTYCINKVTDSQWGTCDLLFMPNFDGEIRKLQSFFKQSLNDNGVAVIPAVLTGRLPELKWYTLPDGKTALGFKDWSRQPDVEKFENNFFSKNKDSNIYVQLVKGEISGAMLNYPWPRAEEWSENHGINVFNRIFLPFFIGTPIIVPALFLLALLLLNMLFHRRPGAIGKLTIFESACSAMWLFSAMFYSMRQELSTNFPPQILLGIIAVFFLLELKHHRRSHLFLGIMQVCLVMIYSYTGDKFSGLLSLMFIGLSYAEECAKFPRETKWDICIGLLGTTAGVAITYLMLRSCCNIYQMLWFGCIFRLWILLRN